MADEQRTGQSGAADTTDRRGAVYADDTSVPRDKSTPSLVHRKAVRPGGYVVVEAAVKPDYDERADIAIRASANGEQPVKWRHVERIVLAGQGAEGRAIRGRLSRATIVITDPLELYREIDLTYMLSGRADQLLALLLAAGPGSRPIVDVFEEIEYRNGLYLLSASGVGRVEEVLAMAGGAAAAEAAEVTVSQVMEALRQTSSKVHQVATKATTLVAYEHDEEALEERLAGIEERTMFFDPRAFYSGWHLEELAGRRVVFDGGHPDITDRIEQLRAVAARHLAEQPMYGVLPAHQGYVVTGDDREEYALQIADMAAGWARQIACTQGLLVIVRTFPLVLYNGRKLTPEEAVELDAKKLHHGRLIGGPDLGTAGRG